MTSGYVLDHTDLKPGDRVVSKQINPGAQRAHVS